MVELLVVVVPVMKGDFHCDRSGCGNDWDCSGFGDYSNGFG